MKISINCPSYKRPNVETLEYLPFCKVWVDHKEYNDYIKEYNLILSYQETKQNIKSCLH